MTGNEGEAKNWLALKGRKKSLVMKGRKKMSCKEGKKKSAGEVSYQNDS